LEAESDAIKALGYEYAGVFINNLASDPADYATLVANSNGIGDRNKDNGITLVVVLDRPGGDGNTPTVGYAVGDGIINTLMADDRIGAMLKETFVPLRSDGAWDKGLLSFSAKLHRLVQNPEAEEFKSNVDPYAGLKLIGIVVVIFIAIMLLLAWLGVDFSSGSGTGGTRTYTNRTTSPSRSSSSRGGGGSSSRGGSV
jgi:uncharacterized membrane protein YgcG